MMSRRLTSFAGALLLAAACTTTPEPMSYTAPKVEFGTQSEGINAELGQTLTFVATVTEGEKVKCSWTVDGVLESSSQTFEYTFFEAGTHSVVFEASNGSGEVRKEYTVTVSDVFSVSLSIGDSTFVNRGQNQTLAVVAIVGSGSGISHEWKVDGAVVCNDAVFSTFVLSEARDYTVTYNGSNAVGSYTKTFTVKVRELPLQVSFSESGSSIDMTADQKLYLLATPLYGGIVAEQKWSLDGSPISSAAEINVSVEEGTHTLSYFGKNASGDEVNKTWTVTVGPKQRTPYVLLDFEDGQVPSTIKGNDGALSVQENKYKTNTNKSSWVLMNNMAASTFGTSGLVHFNSIPFESEQKQKLMSCALKIYLGENSYYPRFLFNKSGDAYLPLLINGKTYSSEAEWKALVKTSDWNVLEWNVSQMGKSSFKDLTGITIRCFVDYANVNKSGLDEKTNNRKVYIDDVVFYE